MVRRLFRAWIIFAWVGKNVGGARQRPDLNLLHLLGTQVVALDQVKHGGNGSVRQGLRREELHPALRNAPRLAESVCQYVLLPLRTVAVDQAFLAIDHVLGTAVAPLGQ